MSESDSPQKAIGGAMKALDALKGVIGSIGSVMLEVAEEGCETVKQQMFRYNIPTDGALGDSISATQIDGNTARIEADGGHATFVEFGTGIVGKNHPHKEAEERGVVYDRNEHGESGWVYPKDGRFYHTKGQPSRPFMYSAKNKIVKNGRRLVMKRLNGDKK